MAMRKQKKELGALGRRERQIMDIVHRRGRASVGEVLEDLEDPPSYSAVRGMLRLLEEKGYVRHRWEGPRYVYLPTGSRPRPAIGGAASAAHLFQQLGDIR